MKTIDCDHEAYRAEHHFYCPDCGAISEYVELDRARTEADRLRGVCDVLLDKALKYDLDRAGISRREREAVELVELRAERDRLQAALKNLLALVEGECPSLLEGDHHYQMVLDALRAQR